MFIENYRLENMIGGQALSTVPYPEISAEDWSMTGVSAGADRVQAK